MNIFPEYTILGWEFSVSNRSKHVQSKLNTTYLIYKEYNVLVVKAQIVPVMKINSIATYSLNVHTLQFAVTKFDCAIGYAYKEPPGD